MSIIEHSSYYETPMYNASHVHTSCEIMYIVSGQVDVTAGEQTVHISDNDCLLIKSRQHHDVRVSGNVEYKRFITIINPWELRKQLVRPDLFTMLTDTSKSGIIPVRNKPDLQKSFETMSDIFKNGGNIYSELSAALSVISVIYDEMKPNTDDSAQHLGKKLADKVRTYIEDNFAENIKIARIAAENFISCGYLTHTFKAETGMSPREYLSHIRCSRAYELICHTDMKISDIAAKTGFCCANDMSRKIREYYGLTPTEIRFGKL